MELPTTGGQPQNDALNLPAMYNKLGLAWGESGANPFVAKEAFAEGLKLAPGDLALLVNGGAAYQVCIRCRRRSSESLRRRGAAHYTC